MTESTTGGPLDGILALDLTRALAGPHAGMMLGDLGARVIKIESTTGDDSRGWGPPFVGSEDERESTYFMSANRNKESIVLNLKDAEDKDVLTRLIQRADVLMENFRVGVLDRLGFSTERLHELNPRLVVLSITGFGHDGPEAARSGYDQIAQGEAGLMSVTGSSPDEPTKVGVPIADLLAGMNGAYGVVAALFERERTGRGRVVRTSLIAGVVGIHAFQGTRWTVGHQVPGPSGNQHPSIAPYGLFHTATSPIQLSCGSESLWRSFAPLVAIDPSEPQFATNGLRVTNKEALIELIEAVFATQPAEHWLARLEEIGTPAGKVRTIDEVYEWEQVRSQGLVIEVDHATQGRLTLPGPVLRFDDNAHAGSRVHNIAPPTLGQHDESIRAWLDETP
ncbi:CaiB/BaiF CoA transferase family protein [Aeromicrobium sp. CF3.5]|uniref:CaiB/BaiF CoA transferase family protein n=1 Tax=Aeromicrobium sp. CF3.5 TaxID=3373078 RepID=UPI003EE685F7